MKMRNLVVTAIPLGLMVLVLFNLSTPTQAANEKYSDPSGHLVLEEIPAAEKTFPVLPAPFLEGVFPCSDCHAGMEPNLNRRQLVDEHSSIILRHAADQRWCLDCHNSDDRDTLRLASGEVIPFFESYRLCGQCHGEKFRDWKVGVHGKRTGDWNGDKQYLLCAHCHDPHDPKIKPLKPLPPPHRPGKGHE